ncbi:MAG: TIGR03557 family F420-dependent LLM class oxidoreductase [Myxococcota bacterium]
MPVLGYTLSSEEFGPRALVAQARLAEEIGIEFAMISDHYHPWTERQGESPFVWTVLGGIAQATERLRVGTGVTCPTVRIHPAIVAQAAASTAAAFGGNRFFLGVGSGELLNEHVLGDAWPEPALRIEMLREAIGIIRQLWAGGSVAYHGDYYDVEEARLFTRPEYPPDLLVAATGPTSARVAADLGDGLVGIAPSPGLIETYHAQGGSGPRFGQIHCCYDAEADVARKRALECWPNAGLPGNLMTEIKTTEQFDAVSELVREEHLGHVVVGPDPETYLEAIQKYADAGYDHLWLHQIGPDQETFLRFLEREILPVASA